MSWSLCEPAPQHIKPGRHPYRPFAPISPVAILNFRPKGIRISDSSHLPQPPGSPPDEKSAEPVASNFSIRHFLRDLGRPLMQDEAEPLPPDMAVYGFQEQPLVGSVREMGRFSRRKPLASAHLKRRHKMKKHAKVKAGKGARLKA